MAAAARAQEIAQAEAERKLLEQLEEAEAARRSAVGLEHAAKVLS